MNVNVATQRLVSELQHRQSHDLRDCGAEKKKILYKKKYIKKYKKEKTRGGSNTLNLMLFCFPILKFVKINSIKT